MSARGTGHLLLLTLAWTLPAAAHAQSAAPPPAAEAQAPVASSQPEAAAGTQGQTTPDAAPAAALQPGDPLPAAPQPAAANADAAQQAPPPASAQPMVPPSTPETSARPARQRRFTREDLLRLRAELAAQRARAAPHGPQPVAPQPRRYGDPTPHFSAGLELSAIARPDDGWERFEAGHTSTRFGLFLGYDVLRLPARWVLAAELGAGLENDEALRLLGSRGGELSSQTLLAALALRWTALPVLSPQLRASGGASFFQLELDSDLPGSPGYETARATSGFAALGVGFLLHTPERTFESRDGRLSSLSFGLLLELGYALRRPLELALHTRAAPGAIQVIDAGAGRLDLSGPYLRSALVLRF